MPAVRIRRLRAEALHIPFKVAFRHASAERAETASLLVEALSQGGVAGHGESCPRPYVTGETLESARAFVAAHAASVCEEVSDLSSLETWLAGHAVAVDANPAAWCAIELSLLDLFARSVDRPVEGLLSRPPLRGAFHYSAVIGDQSPAAFAAMANQYRRQGFTDFKIKLAGDLARDRDKLAVLRDWEGVRTRADANNLWSDAGQALAFLEALAFPFFAIEEPIQPNQYAELVRLARALGCRVVLDESFVRVSQIEAIRADPDRFLVNVRVSKMGGLLRSLRVVDATRAAGLGLVVGAQVGETSLLTRAALTVAQAAGESLVAQEGGFGTHLLARDICQPVLMFGARGVLDTAAYPSLAGGGWGLDVLAPRP